MPEVNAQQFRQLRFPDPASPSMGMDTGPLAKRSRLDEAIRESHQKTGGPPNDFQFTANPNQMAMPGMEEHAHPGAVHLAQGRIFHANRNADSVQLTVGPANPRASTGTASLTWATKPIQGDGWHAESYHTGEIKMVETPPRSRRKGLASALYGIGRQMTSVPPIHSANRSDMGDLWAPAVSKKYGGHVPKNSWG